MILSTSGCSSGCLARLYHKGDICIAIAVGRKYAPTSTKSSFSLMHVGQSPRFSQSSVQIKLPSPSYIFLSENAQSFPSSIVLTKLFAWSGSIQLSSSKMGRDVSRK